eukprot:gnl/MRDRNA2_/MRDRNA2_79249_c0_seq1.p1 gnl/MRDRNA2_/MRDRNA2_79249_c0~~gnl/MRDRNA2_/MRDRNA2_79249_c0_seq1.p1  ORF type:complete len:122 (+),score=18.88 gnl/MRDRNA2_/MRDRNA2_79249_c0_seq1:38-367(+)
MTVLHALLSGDMEGKTGVFVQPYLAPLLSFFKGVDTLALALISQKVTWACHEWIRPHPDSYNKEFASKLWEASAEATGIEADEAFDDEPADKGFGSTRRSSTGGRRRGK